MSLSAAFRQSFWMSLLYMVSWAPRASFLIMVAARSWAAICSLISAGVMVIWV